MSDERRSEPRFELNEPVKARCATWQQFLEVYTRNISQGGIYLTAENTPELNSEVELDITLPDGSELGLHGRVAHVDGGKGFGVQFVDPTPKQIESIKRLVQVAQQHINAPPPPMPK